MTTSHPPLSARAVCRSARVRALYAFGSRERQVWRLLAGGRARGHSDLDLAVLWLSPEAHDRFARRAKLEDALWAGLNGVQLDLVELDGAGTFLNLTRLAAESGPGIDDDTLDFLAEMNRFSVHGRYPLSIDYRPTTEEIARCWPRAREVLECLLLWRLTRKVDPRIEPVPVGESEYSGQARSPLVDEAKRDGFVVEAA